MTPFESECVLSAHDRTIGLSQLLFLLGDNLGDHTLAPAVRVVAREVEVVSEQLSAIAAREEP